MIKRSRSQLMSSAKAYKTINAKNTDFTATQVTIFVYNANQLDHYTYDDLLQNKIQLHDDQVLWVAVTGLKTVAMIQAIGEHFNFHPLAVEDTLNPYQRAKVDDYEGYQFIVAKLLDVEKDTLRCQQLTIFLGKNFVVSFIEHHCLFNDFFDKNIVNALSRLRCRSSDYLTYELLDFATDTVFPILATNSDRLDNYENWLMDRPVENLMHEIQNFKHELRDLRQILWANRDMLSALMRNELGLIKDTTTLFIRDCYDHAIRQMDMLELQRESAVSLSDIYLSSIANRLGEVMKVLTGISIIFMPPTFLAAVWGMNFRDMPELRWIHGYSFAWAVMLLVGIIPSIWFWRKGWLRAKSS